MKWWMSQWTNYSPTLSFYRWEERGMNRCRVVSLWTETPEASFFRAPVQGSFPAPPPLIRAGSLVIGGTVVGDCFSETGWLSQFPAASMCDVTRSSVGGIPRWGCSPRGEAGVGVPLGQPQDKAQSWGSEGDNRLWLRLYMLGEFRAVQWPTPVFLGFPCDSAGKESACNVGDLGSIPGLGRSTGEGNSYPTQYSSLQNYTDWTVHGVAKSQTWLSDFHFTSVVRTHAFTAAEGASSNPGPGKMSSMTTHKKRHALHSQGSSPSSAPY